MLVVALQISFSFFYITPLFASISCVVEKFFPGEELRYPFKMACNSSPEKQLNAAPENCFLEKSYALTRPVELKLLIISTFKPNPKTGRAGLVANIFSNPVSLWFDPRKSSLALGHSGAEKNATLGDFFAYVYSGSNSFSEFEDKLGNLSQNKKGFEKIKKMILEKGYSLDTKFFFKTDYSQISVEKKHCHKSSE